MRASRLDTSTQGEQRPDESLPPTEQRVEATRQAHNEAAERQGMGELTPRDKEISAIIDVDAKDTLIRTAEVYLKATEKERAAKIVRGRRRAEHKGDNYLGIIHGPEAQKTDKAIVIAPGSGGLGSTLKNDDSAQKRHTGQVARILA